MEPLSKLETLVNVSNLYLSWFGGVTISSILYTNDKTITLEVMGVTQQSVILWHYFLWVIGYKNGFNISINKKKWPPLPKKKKNSIKTLKCKSSFTWDGETPRDLRRSWSLDSHQSLCDTTFRDPSITCLIDVKVRHFWQSTVWVWRNTGLLQTLFP